MMKLRKMASCTNSVEDCQGRHFRIGNLENINEIWYCYSCKSSSWITWLVSAMTCYQTGKTNLLSIFGKKGWRFGSKYYRGLKLLYALVIARLRVQYDQYFPVSYFDQLKQHQHMRNEENIDHILRRKLTVSSLWLMYKISTVC